MVRVGEKPLIDAAKTAQRARQNLDTVFIWVEVPETTALNGWVLGSALTTESPQGDSDVPEKCQPRSQGTFDLATK